MSILQIESVYRLEGPQVDPQAARWSDKATLRTLNLPEIHQLAKQVDRYPDTTTALTAEIVFLNALVPEAVRVTPFTVGEPGGTPHLHQAWDTMLATSQIAVPTGYQLAPLSFFLQKPLRPYHATPDVVVGGAGPHVVNNGCELAFAFRDETPGLPHRRALDYLLHQRRLDPDARPLSPLAQALLWAALDVAVASAVMAAWYVKWEFDPTRPVLGGGQVGRARRPRPVEVPFPRDRDKQAVALDDVLYDHPGACAPAAGSGSPGTPRHPAYPSGHSTYSAAASTVLRELLHPIAPQHADAWSHLGDNIGIARLWGGVHWPSDHLAGQVLGNAVGHAIAQQVSHIDLVAPVPNEPPPPHALDT